MPWLAVAAIAAGAGLSAYSNSTKKKGVTMTPYPEYPEAEGARAEWWSKLQEWGKDPNYGAISPDWNNIWEGVQRRVKEYYQGGPLTTGVKDKLKSNLARRNMLENPSSDYMMTAIDAQQGRDLMDADVEIGKQKTALTESGRQFWMNSLSDLSKQKPQVDVRETVTGGVPWADITGAALSSGGQALEMSSIMNSLKTPQTVTSPYASGGGSYPTNGQSYYGPSQDWLDQFKTA